MGNGITGGIHDVDIAEGAGETEWDGTGAERGFDEKTRGFAGDAEVKVGCLVTKLEQVGGAEGRGRKKNRHPPPY